MISMVINSLKPRGLIYLFLFTAQWSCQLTQGSKLQTFNKLEHAAWFTKSTLNSNHIKVCIVNRSGYQNARKLTSEIENTFNKWIQYIDDKQIDKLNKDRAFVRKLNFKKECSDTDLKIIFSAHDATELGDIEPELSYASVFPKQKTMWITNHNSEADQDQHGQWRSLNYEDPYMLQLVLLHEWGHIFGNRHVPGTIMDESLLSLQIEALRESMFLGERQRDLIFGNILKIDFTRELYFSDPLKFTDDLISPPDFQGRYDVKLQNLGENTALLSSRSIRFNHFLYNIRTNTKRLELPHWADAEVFIRQGARPLYHQTAEIEADVFGIHAQTKISRNTGAINMPNFFISYRCPAYTKLGESCRLLAGDWADKCLRALKFQVFYYATVTDSLKTEGIFNKDDLSNSYLKTMIIEDTCGEMIDRYENGDGLRYPKSPDIKNRLAKLHNLSPYDIRTYQGPKLAKLDGTSGDGRFIRLHNSEDVPNQLDLNRFDELCSIYTPTRFNSPVREICTYQSKVTDLMYLYIKDRDGNKTYLPLRKISRDINSSLSTPQPFTNYDSKTKFKMCRMGYRGCNDMSYLIAEIGKFPDKVPGETPENFRVLMLQGQLESNGSKFHIGTPIDLCPRKQAEIGCHKFINLAP